MKTEPAEKDFEPAILKRIIHHMNNAQGQPEPGEGSNLVTRSSYQPGLTANPSSTISVSSLHQNPKGLYGQTYSVTKPTGTLAVRVTSGPVSLKEVPILMTNSIIVPTQNTNEGDKQDPNLSVSGQPRKINAFAILKNTSKMNSMANSIIAEPIEAREAAAAVAPDPKLVSSEKESTPKEELSRRDRPEDKVKGERDHSNTSTTSNQKKMFFQRMITNEVNKEISGNESSLSPTKVPPITIDRDAKMINILMNESGANPSSTSRARASSVKGGEVENKLVKNLLNEPTKSQVQGTRSS